MNDDEEIKIEMAIVQLSILELPINIYTTVTVFWYIALLNPLNYCTAVVRFVTTILC